MLTVALNIGLAFLEGIALIISPCILPVLPIILSGSLDGSRKRPYGIIVGFVLCFSLFTFFSRSLVVYTGIDLSIVRYISYVLLLAFGVMMLSESLSAKFMLLTQRLSNIGSSLASVNDTTGGFRSGLVLGGLVGVIWTPCAGPILAAVIVQTVLQTTLWDSFLIVLAFGLGAAVPMLFIALFGRKLMEKVSFLKTHAYLCRKILGIVIITAVIYMLVGEGVAPVLANENQKVPTQLTHELSTPYQAPVVGGIETWINSSPLQLDALKGKVVLIDFWTYSCINCIRTLPYIKSWYQKYHDKGLVIIGVHAPEFDFEKDVTNVRNAVKKFGIEYPVALDNHFVTWQNFKNKYWPAHYLIDKNGNVVYEHFGEGEYDTTENNIRFLLGIAGANSEFTAERVSWGQTPETYLGSARAANFSGAIGLVDYQVRLYEFPAALEKNNWALQGGWKVFPEKIVSAASGAAIKLNFKARNVFMVMGSESHQPIKVKILLNGEQVIHEKGKDVVNSALEVKDNRLYEVVQLPESGNGVLQIIASAPGLEVFTFTFG